ncbi:MAG: tail fiber domain-containing protein [Bacteroidota bacterium]
MRFLITLLTTVAITLMLCVTAQAQVSPSNSLGIFPPGGVFNQNGKFTAIGESGGVPGPTSTGCDLYGFRAQVDLSSAVSLGVQRTTRVLAGALIPTLVFDDNRYWWTSPQGTTTGPLGPDYGCGPLVAFMSSNAIFGGNVFTIFGSAVANGGSWTPSDRKLKEDVRPIGNALDMVAKLSGVTYRYKQERIDAYGMPTGLQYGFIAQDVQKLIPSAVKEAEHPYEGQDDFVVMRYEAIIPVLNEAIKEQQDIINKLEARLIALEEKLGVEAQPSIKSTTPFDEVELDQNYPNPADGSTIIDYKVPTEVGPAAIVVYDITGSEIRRFNVETGVGQVIINDGELAAGTYIYTIEVEGQNLGRRKMVIQ